MRLTQFVRLSAERPNRKFVDFALGFRDPGRPLRLLGNIVCGITGFVDYKTRGRNSALHTLTRMTGAIAHRGPDGEGFWLDPNSRICLGNRRLSIIDLSSSGSQPMTSASGRYTITFNGEIYGFRQVRSDLERRGMQFHGHSDTEVLLAKIEALGLEATLQTVNGMFAFALFDHQTRRLIFARDRIGKKPLFIGIHGDTLAFGSELKSIREHPAFASVDIDRGALTLYLRYGYVPAPYSIYKGILKLSPGSWVSLSTDKAPNSAEEILASASTYWSAYSATERGQAERLDNENEALELLDSTLRVAVGERMIADVEVGTFLSGGIDSSLVSSILKELSPGRIKTYTIRYTESKYNEADTAIEVANELNSDHTELEVTPQAALEKIASLPEIYDEPFADPSQVPTVLLADFARRHVTVALSGDGGDEAFGGYSRYSQMMLFERLSRKIPPVALRAIQSAPSSFLDALLVASRPFVNPCLRDDVTSDRLKKLAWNLQPKAFDERYRDFLSVWTSPSAIVNGGHEPASAMSSGNVPKAFSEVERMMYLDTVSYLPDDVLVKVDRASMAVGLEVRSPLLDHRFIEAAWRAPRSLCHAGGQGKVALRKLLDRHLPGKFSNLPKQGFGVPINEWLRDGLRSWAEEFLSPARLTRDGIFNADVIAQRWREHLTGQRNWGRQMWAILMFNMWLDRWQF